MKPYITRRALGVLLIGIASLAVACAKEPTSEGASGRADLKSEAAESANTGKVIVVEAYSDEKGSYYKPSVIEAHRGDIVRFTLKSGVHNVNFLADSNSGKTGLPPASDMLQLPGQTYDLKVTLVSGKYYFQCDPHAALGMKGTLEVEN